MKKHYSKYIVPVFCLLLVAGYLIGNQDVSVETLLAFTTKDPAKAAIVMLLLYALKSATIFFPLIILEIAVGHLFSPCVALGINFAGMLIILTIPYLMGKAAGIKAIQKLVQKLPVDPLGDGGIIFPFAHSLAADTKLLSQFLLGEVFLLPRLLELFTECHVKRPPFKRWFSSMMT